MHKFFFEPPQYQTFGKHAHRSNKTRSNKTRSDDPETAIDKVTKAVNKRLRKNKRFLELHGIN